MKTLVLLTGPTGIGKTELSLRIAKELGSPIFSCDSRQMYREMRIGTAAPTSEQLSQVKHFFIGNLSIFDYYSASRFENEAMQLLDEHFAAGHDYLLMTGGSMFYIDAICKGIDDMPDVDPELRKELLQRYEANGLDDILSQLKLLDPVYYNEVDRHNPKRVLHGLELCLMTGKPFSSLRKAQPKQRPFQIVKFCLDRKREELYRRIDCRVEQMMADGLEQEARDLYPHRALNALNTVGYKELFAYFDGKCTKEEAVAQIQFNTHKYARKQLTWFRNDPSIKWIEHENSDETLRIIKDCLYLRTNLHTDLITNLITN